MLSLLLLLLLSSLLLLFAVVVAVGCYCLVRAFVFLFVGKLSEIAVNYERLQLTQQLDSLTTHR
jgi:hypothetical protein